MLAANNRLAECWGRVSEGMLLLSLSLSFSLSYPLSLPPPQTFKMESEEGRPRDSFTVRSKQACRPKRKQKPENERNREEKQRNTGVN